MTAAQAPKDEVSARTRLLEGFALALEERHLVDVTMNDIVRHARTSKRTFYEHFADKQECFLALYRQGCDLLFAAQDHALDPEMPVADLIDALAASYVRVMAARPAISRASLSDIVGGGDACLAARREQHERFAAGLRRLFADAARAQPAAGIRPLSMETAAAVVGGINELVLRAFDAGRGDRLEELEPTISDLVASVVFSR